jgi:FlaA1/EpsC-like NDP-sugar epimerase
VSRTVKLPEVHVTGSHDGEEPEGPRHIGWPDRIVAILRREVALVVLDLGVILGAYLATLVLRFDGAVPDNFWRSFWAFMPVVAFLHLLSNYLFGLYGQMWRYASVQEARRVVLAGVTACGLVLFFAALLQEGGNRPLPLSVIAFGAILSFLGIGAVRFQSRLFGFRRRSAIAERQRVLIVGAGDLGAGVTRDLLREPSLGLDPVAMVDDDPRKQRLSLHGIEVVGNTAAIPEMVRRFHVDEVLLAVGSPPSQFVRDVASRCERADVNLRVLPSFHETMGGRVTARDIRDLRIEDLLGRQQVKTDLAAMASILTGRRVLVTGAGGSIGSEIARQVMSFDAAALVLMDHDETHLHDIITELDRDSRVSSVLADIRDRDRLIQVFLEYRPEIVFHAAAHKHVPVLETYPQEALATNVIGTANVAEAAIAAGTQRFVLISTDKSVNPESVMGASKWFAEQVIWSLQGNGCRFCAVRFGNVLGSRGSVIPTFLRQIGLGGPVTVTDPEMARYFMSVHEAVQLVLQAAALSEGGEVFTLDMGEPVNILDLAKEVIRLAGRVPGKDIEIKFTGARPGEKLVEDLIPIDEDHKPSSHPSILVSRPRPPDRGALRRALRGLESLASVSRTSELSASIKALAGNSLEVAPEQVIL